MKIFDWMNDPSVYEEDHDPLEELLTGAEIPDSPREEVKKEREYYKVYVRNTAWVQKLISSKEKSFRIIYIAVALISCAALIGMLLFAISFLPRYGTENPGSTIVVKRYVENGLEETGALNIIAGIILDYRAFDTLGESHVLFTALMCVTILLRLDRKNMRTQYEDFYTIRSEKYNELYTDTVVRVVSMLLLPCLLIYGAYVLLNGQLSPGGGFSGGTVLGSGMIIFAAAFGFKTADRVLTKRIIGWITFFSLSFYSFAKGYVFFTGANEIENHIPKGTPGAILSGGLILPLDIAVGLVVACTMFGFYSLFRRGTIGEEE